MPCVIHPGRQCSTLRRRRVLVCTDPLDVSDGLLPDIVETYPQSWYLPPVWREGPSTVAMETCSHLALPKVSSDLYKNSTQGSHTAVFFFIVCVYSTTAI